jgi:uncharacterized tellurite resistance protein B-like protein
MSILKALGIGAAARSWPGGVGSAATDSVRRIVRELEQLEPERARFVAAFAYLLGRVANSDLVISDDESRVMEEIVQRLGSFDEGQALLVVEIAKSQNRLFGGTEDFLVTREFAELASDQQKRELLDCLFAVSAADQSIVAEEEQRVRQIASELGFSLREYVEVRQAYSQHREVLKPFRKKR